MDFFSNNADISQVSKSELSKQLFHKINWQEILRAGVFLTHKDVSSADVYYAECSIIHVHLNDLILTKHMYILIAPIVGQISRKLASCDE